MNRAHFLSGASAVCLLPTAARASTIDQVREIARGVPGVIGVYCRTLAAGQPVFALNEHVIFPTASTIKVLIMVTAYVTEEAHPGTLDRTIVTRRSRLVGGSDFMALQPDGARFTVRQLIVPMIAVSDNTASNDLIDFFGMPAINAVGRRLGMRHTVLARHFLDFAAIAEHRDNLTTPYDMALLLFALEHGAREGERTIVSPSHCRAMIDVMLRQTDRNKIPAGLPPLTQVANKTGEISGTRNDIAIVEPYRSSPYILTIFSKAVTDFAPLYHAIHRFARLSYALAGRSNE